MVKWHGSGELFKEEGRSQGQRPNVVRMVLFSNILARDS